MQQPDFSLLKQHFSGPIITPGDSGYEQASSAFMLKGAPAGVVRPYTNEDVAAAVQFACNHSLLLSIRSGGHSGVGFSTNTGGMVIDLSAINSIEVIDKDKHIVRVGAGAKWGDVAKKLQTYGLSLSSGDTKSVGVGGLTLGGGIGWMVRKYGLTIDNLVAAEIVTADGKTLHTSTIEYPDLFWALRGGGGNFGVVTFFEFVTRPISTVIAGPISYALEFLPQVLRGWRDYMAVAPEELNSTLLVMPAFPGNSASVMILCCYAGDDELSAKSILEPLKQLGTVMFQDVKKKPYADILEEARAPEGIRVIAKNSFVEDFNDELIRTIVTLCGKGTGPVLQIRSLGGAMKHISQDATAFAYRNSEVMIIGASFVPLTASDSDVQKALHPWDTIAAFGKGAYVNFLSTATDQDLASVYPKSTYERLAKIKKTYDPNNIFNQNHNIKPL